MIKKIFLALTLSVLLISGAHAAETIPQTPNGYVTDLANLFNETEEAALTTQIKAIDNARTIEIAVLTLSTLTGQEDEDIDNLSNIVFNRWGIGRKDTDNGVLILIALNDKAFRIETGEGIEGAMTAYQTRKIAEKNFIPNFRASNYYKGVSDAITDIELLTKDDPDLLSKYPKEPQFDRIDNMSENAIMFALILSMIISTMYSGFLDTYSPKRHNKLRGVSGLSAIIFSIILFTLSWVWVAIPLFFIFTGIILLVLTLGVIFPHSGGGGHYGGGGSGGIFFGGGGSSGGFGGGSSFGGFGGGFSSGGGFSGGW